MSKYTEEFAEAYPTIGKIAKDTKFIKKVKKITTEHELADHNLTKILKRK